jgi:hypothetical protein
MSEGVTVGSVVAPVLPAVSLPVVHRALLGATRAAQLSKIEQVLVTEETFVAHDQSLLRPRQSLVSRGLADRLIHGDVQEKAVPTKLISTSKG